MAGSVRQTLAVMGMLVATVMGTAAASSTTGAAPAEVSGTSAFVPIGPLRLADTRARPCGCDRLNGSTIRVPVAGRSGVPETITAVSVTVTATPTKTPGFVTTYPSGVERPLASTLNTQPDRVTVNSTIVPVGDDGALELFHLVPGDLVVDITGVFVAQSSARSGRYIPMSSSRLIDTRTEAGGSGPLGPGGDLTVPLPRGVRSDATALVVNVTSVGERAPGHLSARPAGSPPQLSSFVNPNGSGAAIAASVIVPVSAGGFTIRSFSGGHVIVDMTGWFTGPSATESTTGLFRAQTPTRLLDTRTGADRIYAGGTIELPIPVSGAAAVVTNVTVTQADRAGYVVGFPAGTSRPSTSAVNASYWNDTAANTAITGVSTRGIAFWSLAGVDLVIDLSGWFTGEPADAWKPPAPNAPTRQRVLLVGDSTLAGVNVYTASLAGLRSVDAIVDAASCRRLLRPSCLSNTTGLTPNTAYEAILGTPGRLDIVVVKAGYNDWFSDLPREFDAVVHAARVKGAHTILWFTQNEDVKSVRARQAYVENNIDLRRLTALPQYPDVVLADWLAYSGNRPDWFDDGTHVNRSGAYAITDYTARWVAAIEHRPCPRPWVVGGPISDPCPPPEFIGPVPDPIAVNP